MSLSQLFFCENNVKIYIMSYEKFTILFYNKKRKIIEICYYMIKIMHLFSFLKMSNNHNQPRLPRKVEVMTFIAICYLFLRVSEQ